MIYKFYKPEECVSLEIELFNENNQSKELPDSVEFSLNGDEMNEFMSITLNKHDVYKLIGALHIIHKEMN